MMYCELLVGEGDFGMQQTHGLNLPSFVILFGTALHPRQKQSLHLPVYAATPPA